MMPTENNGNGLLLYAHNYSFYAQKVILALHEKKLSFRTQIIDIAKKEQYTPAFLNINPRGEVPVLKDGVRVIPDSSRIIDYLEDNFSNAGTELENVFRGFAYGADTTYKDGQKPLPHPLPAPPSTNELPCIKSLNQLFMIPCSPVLDPKQHPRLVPTDTVERQKMNKFREMIDKIPANSVTMGTLYHREFVRSPKLPFIGPVRAALKSDFEKTGAKLVEFAERMPEHREILMQKAEEHKANYERVTNKDKFNELIKEVDSVLGEVETQLSTHGDQAKTNWLISRDFTVADVALTTLLYRLDVVGLSHHLFNPGNRPLAANYFTRVSTRPSFTATFPGLFFHFKTLLGFKVLGAILFCSVLVAGGVYALTITHKKS